MSHSGRLQAVASLLAVGLLVSCTSKSTDVDTPQQPAESPKVASAAAEQSGDETVPPVLRCQDPSALLEAMAKTAIAPHPGPVRAATLVRAAKTRTGTWYVIGIDRAYVMDNGTPTGAASRALALTNASVGATSFRWPMASRTSPSRCHGAACPGPAAGSPPGTAHCARRSAAWTRWATSPNARWPRWTRRYLAQPSSAHPGLPRSARLDLPMSGTSVSVSRS